MVTINIQKKHMIMIISVLVFLTGFLIVFAYGTSNPSVTGHSVGEIDWSQRINENVGVKSDPNTGWPAGYGGGIKTWDLLAEGSICLGGRCISSLSISYHDCRIVNIHDKNCGGVPGCSISGDRVKLNLPAPWVVTGGNWNSPDYTDSIRVCQMRIG